MSYWMEGDITRLADTMKVSVTDISAILHRRRRVSPRKALKLQDAAKENGYTVPWREWVFNVESKHPAFFGKAKNDTK